MSSKAIFKSVLKRARRSLREWTGLGANIRPHVLLPEDRELYVSGEAPAPEQLAYPGGPIGGKNGRLVSCLCTAAQLESAAFRYWAQQIGEAWRYHRKVWEFCYVCQALYERGLLSEGQRGLGFAVGQEPLPAYFAALGCEIVATDLQSGDPRTTGWAETGQWASGLQSLNERGLCPPDQFQRRVSFRPVDMNQIPTDLRDFDFTWSACSFEHCGSLKLGQQFVWRQMDCLKPGGVAVHTTELNISSNTATRTTGRTVIFRRRDMEEIVRRLRAEGHHVEPFDLNLGTHPLDRTVDDKPFDFERHLRLRIRHWAATSIGLIIRKRSA